MAPPSPFGFLSIVGLGRETDVTEPVDKIYGLLGLADGGARKSIKIDYSQEHKEKSSGKYTSRLESYGPNWIINIFYQLPLRKTDHLSFLPGARTSTLIRQQHNR